VQRIVNSWKTAMTAHPHAFSRTTPPSGSTLFAQGLRPFFLGAGVHAVVVMAGWIAVLATGAWPDHAGDMVAWHGHEMLFGFAAAAIAGFLLTAVPNWTGSRGYAGAGLAALFTLWLAGRLAVSPLLAVPPAPAALLDVAFFPAVAALVLPSIIQARNRRNYVFLGLLSLLTVGSAFYHLDRLGLVPGAWAWGQAVALHGVLFMVALIGGRIVPSFTSSTLRRQGRALEIKPGGRVDRLALGLLPLLAVLDLADPDGVATGVVALLAGLVHGLRLSRWHGVKTLGQPILWVLHLAYLWIPAGLLLKAAWVLVGAEVGMAWVHALTIGAFATMILAVMSRAALGHTGREIVAARPTVAAYLLVTGAALARVAAPLFPDMGTAYAVAGALWIAAFSLFTLVYAPILLRPRADGRPG